MNRLQKKCFMASAGVHSLLLLILVVGPAFLSSKSKSDDVPVLDFIPSILVDPNMTGGGNRNAKPPPAAMPLVQQPAQTRPQPTPDKARDPEQAKPIPKQPKVDPESLETKSQPKHRTPDVSTKIVTRKPNTRNTLEPKSSDATAQAQERQRADQRRRIANQLTSAAHNIREGTSSATDIEYGPGNDNSPTYASYAAEVRRIYENAWEAPEDSATDNAMTKITVTISSDGMVVSSRITQPSRDSHVDKSVQRTLDRVNFIAPFPEGAREKQRTYIINFNLKAKRGLA